MSHSYFPVLPLSRNQRRKGLSASLIGETLPTVLYRLNLMHRHKPVLPDSPLGHLINQRARKHLQKKDLRDLGKWKAVHWSSWHLPEGTAGDINNHFSHQTTENECRVRGGKKTSVLLPPVWINLFWQLLIWVCDSILHMSSSIGQLSAESDWGKQWCSAWLREEASHSIYNMQSSPLSLA